MYTYVCISGATPVSEFAADHSEEEIATRWLGYPSSKVLYQRQKSSRDLQGQGHSYGRKNEL